MFGHSFFGAAYFGASYFGPAAGAVVVIHHSPYYSEFSEYSMADGELRPRFPWARANRRNARDEQDIMDILTKVVELL